MGSDQGCFLQQHSLPQYLGLEGDCSLREIFAVKQTKKMDIRCNQGVVVALEASNLFSFKYRDSGDIVEAADSCFCLMLEG